MSTGSRAGLHPRRYAIPFERVWRAAARALEAEGADIDDADDTAGLVVGSGETGFPRQRWRAEIRVRLDEDAQTCVELAVHHLEGVDLGRTGRRARRLLAGVDEACGADGRTRIAPVLGALCVALGAAGACAEEAPPPPSVESPAEPAAEAPPVEPVRTYERSFAFRAVDMDSALAVVWLFESEDLGDEGVRRRGRGMLLRGGVWDEFLEFTEGGPPSESPWRITPAPSLRLVVGTGDQVANVVYEEADRLLDLELRGGGTSWTGSRGGTFGVRDAAVVLGDRAVGGRAIDLSRAWRPTEGPPGDWLFLSSGDSIAVVANSTRQGGDGDTWQGWVLRGERQILLPDLELRSTGTRAYDEARRDVPIAWSLEDPGGELTGTMQVRTVRLRPGEGDGPLLPVDGVFEVTGTIMLEGAERAVEGLYRHRQGAAP